MAVVSNLSGVEEGGETGVHAHTQSSTCMGQFQMAAAWYQTTAQGLGIPVLWERSTQYFLIYDLITTL